MVQALMVALMSAGLAPAVATPLVAAPAVAPDTVVVKMVNKSAAQFAFAPSHVTVHPGDVVVFEQTGSIPHNVQFTKWPSAAKLGSLKMGPFLTAAGQKYVVKIDNRFSPGHYDYICTPHAALGMKATLDVVAR